MTHWLRTRTARLLARPIRDERRPVLMAVVALAVAGAAVALIAAPTAPEPARRSPTRQDPAATAAPTSTPSSAPADPVAPPSSSSEESVADPMRITASDIADAKRAARRFLSKYLAYTYGRTRAARIPAATDALRRALAAAPPRVPARERYRRPRITTLQANGATAERVGLLALINDSSRTYTVRLELTRAAGRWQVAELGAT